jgi:hypothetical protein
MKALRVVLALLTVAAAATAGGVALGIVPSELAGLPLNKLATPAAFALAAMFSLTYMRVGVADSAAPVTSSASTASAAPPPVRIAERQAEVARNAATLKAAASEATAASTPQHVRIDGHDGHFIEVDTVPQEDGTVQVVVMAHNYSGKKFGSGVQMKLQRIKGITWAKAENLGNGDASRKRRVVGTTSAKALAEVMQGIALIK